MKPNAVTCLLLIFCVMNLFFGCSQRKAAPLPELQRFAYLRIYAHACG